MDKETVETLAIKLAESADPEIRALGYRLANAATWMGKDAVLVFRSVEHVL